MPKYVKSFNIKFTKIMIPRFSLMKSLVSKGVETSTI